MPLAVVETGMAGRRGIITRMSYAELADDQGYMRVGSCMVHVEALRSVPVGIIAHMTGISVSELVECAQGAWAPLGLNWTTDGTEAL